MTHLSPGQFFEKMVAKDGTGEALLIKCNFLLIYSLDHIEVLTGRKGVKAFL